MAVSISSLGSKGRTSGWGRMMLVNREVGERETDTELSGKTEDPYCDREKKS